MNPWLILLLVNASVVFGLDYLFRRKKWKDNSKEEKISLIINMFSVAPYIFLSVLGMLWGIAANSPKTALGNVIYDVTITMGGIFFIIAIIAVIMSFVFRKIGRVKASIWINIIAFVYIILVLGINNLAGKLL